MLENAEILRRLEQGEQLETICETEDEYQQALKMFSNYNKTSLTTKDFFVTVAKYFQEMKGKKITKYNSNGMAYKVDKPITIEGFCSYAGISRNAFDEVVENPNFSDIGEWFKTKVASEILENGLVGNYNSNLAQIVLGVLDNKYKKDAPGTSVNINMPNLMGMDESEIKALIVSEE
jgi:hypothetical protein